MIEAVYALGIEAAAGYPQALHRRVGHPVEWIGAVINKLDQRLNCDADLPHLRKLKGSGALLVIGALGAGFGLALEWGCGRSSAPLVFRAIAAVPGLAQRSLHQHVAAVVEPLERGRLDLARAAVGRIVGRDVQSLDETGISKAALESLAESFNDGVVSPAVWLAIGGLPALYAYKAVNTADSMIGHLEPRWRQFGWAAARTDDLMNFVPARVAGLLLVLAGGGGGGVMVREAPRHASPNAGWPEAAMAATLNVELGGCAVYDGQVVDRPVFSHGARPPGPQDLRRGLAIFRRALALQAITLSFASLATKRR